MNWHLPRAAIAATGIDRAVRAAATAVTVVTAVTAVTEDEGETKSPWAIGPRWV
jgi:hypothetical protein